MPLVSIILTSYNHEKFINEAIDSVINQTFSDWEMFIFDDGSTDNSWNIIKSYNDPRIQVFHNSVNQGPIYAFNRVIFELARGKYIAVHHSDDAWETDKLEKQVAILDDHSEVGAVFTWVQVIDENGTLQENNWFDQQNKSQWQWLSDLFFMRNHLAHPSVLIRKECYQELGGYKKYLAQTPDVEMWSRLLIRYPIHLIPQKLTKHRLFSDKSNTSGDRIDVAIRVSNEWNLLRENFLSIDNFESLVATFPSLEHYRNANRFNTKFLLAMVCLSECSDRASWRLAITWLFDLLRNLAKADEIEQLYSFTYKELIKLTGEVDVNALEELAKRDRALAERDAALAERDAALAERDAAVVDLDAILRSKSWKITKAIRASASFARSIIASGQFLQINAPSFFTWIWFKKGLVFLKNGDISGFKTAFENTLRENFKRTRLASMPERILGYPLSPKQPLVSVIIPCFNYGRFVVDAIDSILAQTLTNVEIIVVDGGSTDKVTVEILKAIIRPRTTILFREGRHLVGDNRNFGIAKAKGRYICCLDADDTLNTTYLEKAVFQLETYGYDIVSTAINFIGAKEGQLEITEFPDLSDMVSGNHVLTCAVFRRHLWESSGGYVDVGVGKHHVAEDWDYWLRLTAKGARIRNIAGEALFNYRVHQGGSLSSASDVKPLQKQKEAILARNRELLTPEAFRMSAVLQSKNLRCNPSETALALNFNVDATSKNKTLLLAIPFSMVGGAERLLSGLCLYLANNGWKVIVVTTLDHDKSFGSSIEWFKESTSEVYELPRFLQPEERGDFIHYLISSRKPDCLINAGSRLVYEQLPLISGTYTSLCVVDLLFNTVGHVKSHMEFKKFCNFALAENQEVYDWYIEVAGWQSSHIRKLSSGVDLDSLKPTSRSEVLTKKYGITHDELVIGFSGRLSKEKAPDIFVEIAKLCHGVPNLRFIMTGSGPMAETIAMKVKSLPKAVKFEFAGLVDDINQHLALYDLLVLPSRFDGRPLVVMEALACGVPVIASSVGALSDLIDSEKNGYLLPAADAGAFAEKVRYLAKNRKLLEQMKANARQVAEERLGATAAYRGYEVALTDAIDKHRELNVFVK